MREGVSRSGSAADMPFLGHGWARFFATRGPIGWVRRSWWSRGRPISPIARSRRFLCPILDATKGDDLLSK